MTIIKFDNQVQPDLFDFEDKFVGDIIELDGVVYKCDNISYSPDSSEKTISFKSLNAEINSVLDELRAERIKQLKKWGEQKHSLTTWIAILTEEVGEAAKEAVDFSCENNLIELRQTSDSKNYNRQQIAVNIQEYTLDRYRKELIQTAAVAVQMVEAIDKERESLISKVRV